LNPLFLKQSLSVGVKRLKEKRFFENYSRKIALESIETCFHWILTEISAFGNHIGSELLFLSLEYFESTLFEIFVFSWSERLKLYNTLL